MKINLLFISVVLCWLSSPVMAFDDWDKINLTINGFSDHKVKEYDTDTLEDYNPNTNQIMGVRNEFNPGLGFEYKLSASGLTFLYSGFYHNSYYKTSFYAGTGIKNRIGLREYFEYGIAASLVTGYYDSLDIQLYPFISLGSINTGSVNISYGFEYQGTSSVVMVNYSLPIKNIL